MIWIQLGNTLKEALRYDEALAAYNHSLKIRSQPSAVSAEAHLQLGHLYKRMNAPGKSRAAYLKALQQDPSSAAAQELSGTFEMKLQPSREILVCADNARALKQWLQAAALYKEYLSIPGHAKEAAIWVQLGHMKKEAGLHDEALGNYQQAIRLEPNVADCHLQLGHLLKVMGAQTQAVASYKQALRLDNSLRVAREELFALGIEDEMRTSVIPQMLNQDQVFDSVYFPLHAYVLSRVFADRPLGP